MFDNIHENTQNSHTLWNSVEPPLSQIFNIEASKDKPHPNAEYEHKRKKKKSGPSIGGGQFRQKRKARHAQAATPFSIRLTPAEKARLREDAAGEPLGTYVKKTLFAPTTKAAARRTMIDQHAKLIGQVLAMIGSSGIADALTTMALAIQSGTFEDEEDIKTALNKAKVIGETKDTMDDVLDKMLKSKISFVKNSAYRFLQKDSRERASVVSTAHANTHFLESARIRESLSKSDFSFADLKGDTPVTVYLTLPLDRMSMFSRWLRLLISTGLIELTRQAENKQSHPVRFILNEFAALGRLGAVETAFGTMAGLDVQLWVITQDLSQLKRLYGAENWQTFVANAGVFQYFGSRDYETAKYAEHLCGLSTLKKRSVSFGTSHSSSGQGGSSGNSETVSIDDVQRPLIFADELMRMPRDEQLLLVENLPPIRAKKWWWYRNQTTPENGVE